MVDVADMRARDFTETTMINPDEIPEGDLTISRAERVMIKSGVSQGQEKLVLELADKDKELYSWFPNKTSIGNLCEKFGNDTDKWLKKEIKLTTESVMVQGKKRKMILVA